MVKSSRQEKKMTIFEKFADAFPFVSDEKKRWGRESRLLVELARESGAEIARVLDLGCGSGFHARHMAMEGFEVTGVDLSGKAIERGKILPGGDRVSWIKGDITEYNGSGFDLVLLVGNTLSLFEDRDSIEKIFRVAFSALVDGGAFLLHVIDFDHLRDNPVRIRREGNLDGKNLVLEKRITPVPGGAEIRIQVEFENDKSEPESETERIYKHDMDELTKLAENAGLIKISEYGSMQKTERAAGKTKDAVVVFRKIRQP